MDDKLRGVDFTKFSGFKLMGHEYPRGLLFYDDGKLTDHYYIKYVGVTTDVAEDAYFSSSGIHPIFICGNCNVGDYLTTSPIRGCAIVTTNKQAAFGRAVTSRGIELGESFELIGECYAEIWSN